MSIIQSLPQAVNGRRPRSFKEMDLRFFTKLHFADTFNGKGGAAEGCEYTIFQYGGKTAYKRGKVYSECAGGPEVHRGDRRFEKYHAAAWLYLRIQAIARAKYFGEPVPAQFPDQEVESRDLVSELREGFEIMEGHPQFRSLVEKFGLHLTPVGDEGYQLRVEITKSYHEKDAA